ncbi:MAG: prepilin-type N-terminal cleavage/methylation domain-containing protein [Candidatus Peribacteria bacterium]|nr:MAG: prepilin-type N-terminal cleavage/methylation domain-containing protein [Candidatus Peribacteria bacterium]
MKTRNWQLVTRNCHRSFTLIEIIIVLIVTSILMMMTVRIGGNLVRDVQSRQLRESRVSDVTAVRGRLLLSRYDQGQSIEQVVLDFDTTGMTQTIYYIDDTTATTVFGYTGMTLSPLTVTLIPYQLACGENIQAIAASGNIITLSFDRSNKQYCYALTPTTCTFSRVECVE